MITTSRQQIYAQYEQLKNDVLEVDANCFNDLSIRIFNFQYQFNPIYRHFVSNLSIDSKGIQSWTEIPCMPISFFKRHNVLIHHFEAEMYFLSSGTTTLHRSKRLVADLPFYKVISKKSFEFAYGPIDQYRFFAILPNYQQNPHSSLIMMLDHFMNLTNLDHGGYYKSTDIEKIRLDTKRAFDDGFKPILIGVSFALLDLLESPIADLPDLILMETGGMKGKRRELTRDELHTELKNGFGLKDIHSEYGMSELYSQMYAKQNGQFFTPPWLKVRVMEIYDPLTSERNGKTGRINIIDLANLDACCFIATDDLGKVNKGGDFSISGRLDNADVRGCNLMALNE